jgi:hypothetical protein
MVVHSCNSSYWEAYVGGSESKAGPGQKCETIQKITKAKKVWECGSSGRMPALQAQVQTLVLPKKWKEWFSFPKYLFKIKCDFVPFVFYF